MDHALWVFVALVFIAGSILPVQAGVNAELRKWLGHAAAAALVSFAVGTLALLAFYVAARHPWPALGGLGAAPWWAWVGGLLGAFYVTVALVAAPRIGAAALIALLVAGQMVASLLLDHFGALGFPHHPASPLRLLGAALLLSGVVLVRAF